MQVDDQQILSLSQELWETHLGLTIDVAGTEDQSTTEKTLSSCINVSGPWQGTILFECSESVVRHAAAMLFASDGETTSQEDIHDALQELAVMIGRKMRRLLPEASKLSRPSIVIESSSDGDLSDLEGLSDLKLMCEGRPVRIALLRKQEEAATA